MSIKQVKDMMKVAYFCRQHLKDKLQSIRKTMGRKRFEEVLGKLEGFSVLEYPIEYPEISADFPRGIPYPGVNYFLIRFIYYPAWIRGYLPYLDKLKKLIIQLGITKKAVEDLREEISSIDPNYKGLLEEQIKTIASWNDEDKKVLEQILDPTFTGEIKFSESTMYWNN